MISTIALFGLVTTLFLAFKLKCQQLTVLQSRNGETRNAT